MQYAAHYNQQKCEVQTVQEHCLETAKLAAGYGKRIGAEHLAKLTGLLHDIGKFTEQFNEYVRGSERYHRGEIDHSYAGAKYICEKCGEMGAEYYEVSRFIARLIVSHHGLHDWIDFTGNDYLNIRIQKNESYENVVHNIHEIIFDEELEIIIQKANQEYQAIRNKLKSTAMLIVKTGDRDREKRNRKTAYAFYMGLFERLLESVLIDADRTNTAEFMTERKIEHEYQTEELFQKFHEKMEQKTKDFLKQSETVSRQKDSASEFGEVISDNGKNVSEHNKVILRQRNSISERCKSFAEHEVGICQLIVPTGGGKTLSSLRFAIEYCNRHHMERIIYVAPFMSILEQNSNEIRQIVGDENFLEHHSDAVQKIETTEELEEYELYTEKWNIPVIATTMVQFLNTLFLGKLSSVRRLHRLSRAVIVIDEVQSLPVKCVNMFQLAMNFLKTVCGSTIVLCSATQPNFTDSEFPVLLDEVPGMAGDFKKDFEVFKRTEIIPCIRKYGYTYEQAADFCYEKFQENQSLLLIVNTKASAQKMFSLLSERNKQENDKRKKAVIVHLSTNMCPEHRKDKLSEIKNLLKCEETSRKRVICVSTQLIEAGVDISFGSVVRFMAGMDNAAQAAGRCNRSGEEDRIAPVYVINVKEEKLGSLTQIKQAQENSRRIFESEQINDYLSVETMQKYFCIFYKEQKGKLSYEECDGDVLTTLLNLLSVNKNRWEVRKDKGLKYCAQAFKTAGTLFKVIDDNANSVIVPYNDEAEEILLKLNSGIGLSEAAEELRKAQKYMVDIRGEMIKKLSEKNAIYQTACGALGLRKEYYNSDFGISLEGTEQEVLIF